MIQKSQRQLFPLRKFPKRKNVPKYFCQCRNNFTEILIARERLRLLAAIIILHCSAVPLVLRRTYSWLFYRWLKLLDHRPLELAMRRDTRVRAFIVFTPLGERLGFDQVEVV